MALILLYSPLGYAHVFPLLSLLGTKINSSLFKNRSKVRNKLLGNATFLIYFTK